MKKSELKEIIKECVREVIAESRKLSEPIIPDAIKMLKGVPGVKKYTDKKKFDKDLESQNYFSASHSHSYYSKEDLDAARSGDKRFRKGSTGISESDRGAVLLSNLGDLVAVWSPIHKVGYIVPSK